MNKRLLAYIRSLMHNPLATEAEARSFMASLRGTERTIANILDYDMADTAAQTTADLAIRSLGFDPSDPLRLLSGRSRRQEETEEEAPARRRRRRRRRQDVAEDEEREDALEDEEREDALDEEEREGEEEEEREDALDDEEREEEEEEGGQRSRRSRLLTRGARLERQRQRRLRELAGDVVPRELVSRAIREGWSVRRASPVFLQAVRDGRGAPLSSDIPGRAPAGHSRSSVTNYEADALMAAMMMRGSTGNQRGHGITDPVARRYQFNEHTGQMRFVDASRDDRWCRAVERGYELRNLPMIEVARRCLELGGVRVEHDAQQVMRAFETRATPATVQAYTGIYTQTFGALLLDSYLGTRDSTAQWTVERDNPNFLQNERHRVTKGGELTRHAKGGTAEDFALEDTTEYTRVFRYSGKTAIDEIDLINDTMFNAMRSATPEEMGESARRLRPNLVYAILLANPQLADGSNLFNATYGNLLYDATLNKTNLQRGTTVIRTRQENGVNLDLEARFLITPQALSYDARELIRAAQVVIAGDTDTIRPNANALVDDGLVHVSDSRLDNGVTDPASGTAYAGDTDDYYVAAPASRHTIEVTYLRGSSRVPQLRSGMYNQPGEWGVWFDVKHDLGAKALARAGLCKLTPSAEPT